MSHQLLSYKSTTHHGIESLEEHKAEQNTFFSDNTSSNMTNTENPEPHQKQLSQEVALCLGVGGVGSCIAISLCCIGLKKVILVDYGTVELHHLNSQKLYYAEDVGMYKVEAAKKNLQAYNVRDTEIETFTIDALSQWNVVCDLAQQCTIVFNTINHGKYFDLIIQSLCLHLKIPFISSSASANQLMINYFGKCGQPCLLCATNDANPMLLDQIMPEGVMDHQDIQFLPESKKQPAQSTIFLNSICADFMLTTYINQLSQYPENQSVHRLMFHVNSLQPIIFPIKPKDNCRFCAIDTSSTKDDLVRQYILKKEKTIKPKNVVRHPYLDFYPLRNMFEFEGISIDSNFETGNLKRVVQVTPNRYDLWIAPDCYQTQFQITQKSWFHFRTSKIALNDQPTRVIYFTLRNISTNQHASWEGGMVPVYLSKPHKTTWSFIPDPLTSYAHLVSHLEVGFKFEFTKQDEEVYFAFTFPYTYTDAINYATDLENRLKNDPDIYFSREHLINTVEGRRLDLLTITAQDPLIINGKTEINVEDHIPHLFPSHTPPAEKPTFHNRHHYRPIKFNKKYILFGARVHPGEHAASYMLQGFLNSLLNKNDIVSRKLLENFAFVIIPMLNPDGVVRGHYRVDTRGIDLNKVYCNPQPNEEAGPYAFKELAKEGRLAMVIDFHAIGLEEAAFVCANYVPSQEERAEIRLFTRLFDIYSKTFDIQECHLGYVIPHKGDIGESQCEIYNATGLSHVYTLEVSYNRGTKHPERYTSISKMKFDPKLDIPLRTRKYMIDTTDFEEVGESLRHAILELFNLHPCSKIPQTIFRTRENVKLHANFEVENKKLYH